MTTAENQMSLPVVYNGFIMHLTKKEKQLRNKCYTVPTKVTIHRSVVCVRETTLLPDACNKLSESGSIIMIVILKHMKISCTKLTDPEGTKAWLA